MAGREEGADAVFAGLPVDVVVVVLHEVEWGFTSGLQEFVEDLLPGTGVDPCGLGDHAVEVEEAGADGRRQA